MRGVSGMRGRGRVWFLAGAVLVLQCAVCFAAEEDASAAAAAEVAVHEVAATDAKAGTGAFPAQELRQKAEDVERTYLAQQKVNAEDKERKWQLKVLKVKVNRYADGIEEKKNKHAKLRDLRIHELTNKRDALGKAQASLVDKKDTMWRQGEDQARGIELNRKAAIALRQTIKKTTSLVQGEGIAAFSDRKQAKAMLSKLLVAEAHADGSISGLTKRQANDMQQRLLHANVEAAVGDPSQVNVDAANSALKKNAAASHLRHQKSIDELGMKLVGRKSGESKEKAEEMKNKEMTKELRMKRKQEADGEKIEQIANVMEMPGKKIKENQQKRSNEALISNWASHQQRITDELGTKSKAQTDKMIIEEVSQKKLGKADMELQTKTCVKVTDAKVDALEKREKAISKFSQARTALIEAQAAANGGGKEVVEETAYVNKGPECQLQDQYFVGEKVAASATNCKEKCTEAGKTCNAYNSWKGNCQLLKAGAVGDHVECPVNEKTGEKECPLKPLEECTIFQKISGPGSEGRELGESSQAPAVIIQPPPGGCNGKVATVPAEVSGGAAAKTLERNGKCEQIVQEATEKVTEKAAKAKVTGDLNQAALAKTDEANAKKMGDEQAEKGTSELANEGKTKQTAINSLVSAEEQTKTALKNAERQAANAETKMQEANSKAADKDTQARKCEGSMLRRRRTCACDDAPSTMTSELDELGEAEDDELGTTPENSNWERRRYVRRRYVEPSATDRRRRLEFPAPLDGTRLPGRVCPCCPQGQSPKSTQCQLADAKAEQAQAIMAGANVPSGTTDAHILVPQDVSEVAGAAAAHAAAAADALS